MARDLLLPKQGGHRAQHSTLKFAGKRTEEANPAKGEDGALWVEAFLSTEFRHGRLEAKPENGETGTESMDPLPPVNWSRLWMDIPRTGHHANAIQASISCA